LGREQQARDELTELSADSFGRIPRDAFWLLAISQLAQAAFNLDERDHAAALYELLEPYGDRVCAAGPGFACYGVISRHLGQLATTLERFEAAEHHFEQAIELSARIDGPAWLVHSQIDYARMLLRRDAPGDRRRAVELLSIALEKARELKMTTATEAALALKLEAQGIDTLSISTSIDAVQASVQAQRPDLRSHAAPDGTVTLLFTDIEGSTAMTELLGDRRWLELLGDHNKIVRDELRAYEGFEVKSQGDGFMIAFASAGRALLCAVGIQRAIDAFTIEHPVPPLRVRIGLHTGEAIREGDDFFGRDVILAARIAAHARGGEILVSSLLKALVEPSGEWTFGDEREIELKGLRGKQRLTSVRWQPEPAPVAS
jgi:class 3 adenylate cyclase